MEKELFAILESITGSGNFASTGEHSFVYPGLHVSGVGEISIPILEVQTRAMIEVATRAPFGKGSHTIIDPLVRSTWELDASQTSFHGDDWDRMLASVLLRVKHDLGIDEQTEIAAKPYKMLIYEPGDFFLPHRDSEKESGMFGTLVLGLPSVHEGGQLVIRFGGKEIVADFSRQEVRYKIPYCSFFADCEHELKPVTSGYRVCMVYNLVRKSSGKSPMAQDISTYTAQLRDIFDKSKTVLKEPVAILLGHQYTPSAFSLEGLKLNDRPRAEAIMNAAGDVGYFTGLGLVTRYLMGELEYAGSSNPRNWGKYRSGDNSSMGEVYETTTSIVHWADSSLPDLGKLDIDNDRIFTTLVLGDGEPTEQEGEDYTGNAGMIMEYWYHYGAVIIWPRNKLSEALANADAVTCINWLNFLTEHWNQADIETSATCSFLLTSLAGQKIASDSVLKNGCSGIAVALVRLNDLSFVLETGVPLLKKYFCSLESADWQQLFDCYGTEIFEPVFAELTELHDVRQALAHLLGVLLGIGVSSENPLIAKQVKLIPHILVVAKTGYSYSHDSITEKQVCWDISIVRQILLVSASVNDESWQGTIVALLTKSPKRIYYNKVLLPILTAADCPECKLAEYLREDLINNLRARVQNKPEPPVNWSRSMPSRALDKCDAHIWEWMAPFLRSPVEHTFYYARRESDRRRVEKIIRGSGVDLATETIRSGSPHTLVISKTQASYERNLEQWQEDIALFSTYFQQ